MRKIDEYKTTTNPRVHRMYHRLYNTSCSFCPPNRSENAKSYLYKRKKKEFELKPSQKRWRKDQT